MTVRKFPLNYRGLRLAGIGALLVLGVGACDTDRLTNVNEDPNNPTSAPPQAVFTYATRIAMQRWFGSNPTNMRGPVLTAQHLAQVQYPDEDTYRRLDGTVTNNSFLFTYISELKNFQAVINAGREADQPLLWGPPQIMRSLLFGYVTDVWGDVPYSEALQGDEEEVIIQPAYDPQQEIYAGIFRDLNEAVTAIAGAPASAVTLGGADPLYGGNSVKWQRFGNSLRARHAMRMANINAAGAEAELEAAIAAPGGLIQSNADNAQMNWPGGGVYDNPWSVNNQTRDDHRLSERLLNQMVPYNDPRVSVYAQPTLADPNVYAGMPNGLSATDAATYSLTSSRPGSVFYSNDAFCADCPALPGANFPSFVLTYAEVSFILAEAAARGWIAGNPAALYEQGIRASMEQWGVTDQAAINAFLLRPEIVYVPGPEGLRRIALQKWIALYTDGVQAWSEWRRTCVPATVVPGPDAIINSVPRRYQYSIREQSVNGANVEAAIARQGPDEFTTRIWWDSNPTAAPTYPGASCGVRP
ncbi:MAG TPA: SusD/RagB family nutrient-binding outer membrane lipoprotein [Gemmatimonadaceae bacterium]|nr:SusD/RagB family nutrient-binding outer membrane lipoprotein [Gemmatimonadaceae bacterium]